jgi:hypothetical protein
MFWFCAALSAAGMLECVICSCIMAEFAGYWMHRVLNSDKAPFVSPNQIAHHLLLYGPTQPTCSDIYQDTIRRRSSLAGHITNNFGIAFFLFRRIVHALGARHRPVNKECLAIPLQRYRLGMPLYPLGGDRTGEREAAFQ